MYGIDENTAALKCIDPVTGNRDVVKLRGFSTESSVLSASNQIIVMAGCCSPYVPANNGNIVVVQATPTAYTELHRLTGILNNYTFTMPTLCNGLLYVRSMDGTLICYKVGEPPPPAAAGFKMEIQFTGYTPAAPNTMTNFPALVVFSNNMNNSALSTTGRWLRPAADDLRFLHVGPVHGAELRNRHMESKRRFLCVGAGSRDCEHERLYLGILGRSTGLTKPAYTTNGATWDSNFVGVWHMNEAVTNGGIQYDSTANHNNGVWNAAGTSVAGVPAVIGNGNHVNGTGAA